MLVANRPNVRSMQYFTASSSLNQRYLPCVLISHLKRVLSSRALPSPAGARNRICFVCCLGGSICPSRAAFEHHTGEEDVLVSLDKAKVIADAVPEAKV